MSSREFGDSTLNKTTGEQSGSAKTHLDAVANLAKTTRLAHQAFHKDLEILQKNMAIITDNVRKNPTELKKFFKQKMKPVEDTLVHAEENQKQQNKSAQEEMTEIKRENRQTSDSIVKTFEKLKYMETRVGHYL